MPDPTPKKRKHRTKPIGDGPKVGSSATRAKDEKKVAAGKAAAAKRGGHKTPGSGRKAGTPNKRSLELLDVLQAAGYDPEQDNPVVWMLKVYTGDVTMPVVVTAITKDGPAHTIENVPLEPTLRVRCMAEVAQYLYPKRKASEHTGPDGGEIQVARIERVIVDPKDGAGE